MGPIIAAFIACLIVAGIVGSLIDRELFTGPRIKMLRDDLDHMSQQFYAARIGAGK